MSIKYETMCDDTVYLTNTSRILLAASLMAAVFAVAMAAVIVNIALPQISLDLDAKQVTAHWLTTGYTAAGTLTMLLSPRCARAYGVRRTLSLAMLVFIAAAVASGTLGSLLGLIVARILQGMASGFIITLAFIVIAEAYPIAQRGRAISIIGFGMILAPTLGPTVGGIVVDFLGWRWLMYLPIPFSALFLVMGYRVLPELKSSLSSQDFDFQGFVLLSVLIFGVLLSITFLQTHNWPLQDTIILSVSMLVIMVWLFIREGRCANPVVDFRLFLFPGFGAASVVAFAFGLAVWGAGYILPIFLQTARGFSASEAGWILLPGGLVMIAVMPLAGRLADSCQTHRLIISGLLCFALAFIFLSITGGLSVLFSVLLITLLATAGRGLGLGIMIPALDSAASRALPSALLPEGLAMINFLRQLGGAISPGLVALVLELRISANTASLPRDEEMAAHIEAVSASYDQSLMLIGGMFLLAVWPAWKMRKIN